MLADKRFMERLKPRWIHSVTKSYEGNHHSIVEVADKSIFTSKNEDCGDDPGFKIPFGFG